MPQPFAYRRARDLDDALDAAARPGCAVMAGGTELLQLWKAGIARPELVVDIGRLPLDAVDDRGDRLVIGALAPMSDVADHPAIRERCPAVAQALLSSASPQVRNAATIGGNLLQRTRCVYFRGADLPCNKRRPGSGCGAREGESRFAALFGTSEHCVAAHASDLAVALVALGATVRLCGSSGERELPLEQVYVPPGNRPERETALRPGELIAAVEVPATALARRSGYRKVRDRAAFEFALVSAAVALEIEDGVVAGARVAAGGVSTTPRRLRRCEAALIGAPPGEQAYHRAAELACGGARPLAGNQFKLDLLRRTIVRALVDIEGVAG
jgi:xanthine dehydrogenase YagS FAD-binding subunit